MNGSFKKRRLRIGALTVALAGLFLLAAIRLAVLVLIDGPRLSSLAREEHTTAIKLAAVRGPIVDRNGDPLALSAETRSIFARAPKLLETSTANERVRLAHALAMTPAELEAKLRKPAPFVWLARHLQPEQATPGRGSGFRECRGSETNTRGFTRRATWPRRWWGWRERMARGSPGLNCSTTIWCAATPVELQFYHDALGHPILDSPLALKSAKPGARLELTIDSSIQSAAENYLTDQVDQAAARDAARR